MNESEWNELQKVWKSLPPKAEPVAIELERLRRRRRWFAVEIFVEGVIAVAGLSVAAWLIARGGERLVVGGIAICVFVAVVCALSAWARLAPRSNPDDAVGRAVAVARQHAVVRVRLAAATIWGLVAGMVFHDWQPGAGLIQISSASVTPRWLTAEVRHKMFSYPFDEIGCQMVVLEVSAANTRMVRIAKAFGFTAHFIQRLRGRNEDGYVFTLTDDAWRNSTFTRKHHGQTQSTDAA